MPLAVFPLLFAVQQSVEGVLWLYLPGATMQSPETLSLAMIFIVFAEIMWPVLTPIAVLMIEPERRRRQILRGLALLGLVVAGYLLHAILDSPIKAKIYDNNIRYFNDFYYLIPYRLLYVTAITGPLLLSSHRTVQTFGVLVFMGFTLSLYLFFGTLISVWCFFAAAASGVLYFHFSHPRTVLAKGR